MEIVAVIIVILIVAALAAVLFKRQNEKKQCEAEEAERKRLEEIEAQKAFEVEFNAFLQKYELLKNELDPLFSIDYGYLTKRAWDRFVPRIRESIDTLNAFPDKYSEVYSYEEYQEYLSRFNPLRTWFKGRNAAYIEREKEVYSHLFQDIDGKDLDDQQIEAVITDEDNNLVIAGAGSGKTLTVVGKLRYLTERRGVQPSEILVTSFTRKSVGELAERIEKAGIKGVSCKTFHKIGLERLGKVGVANENELRNCVFHYLRKGILDQPEQMSAYIEFYGCYKHMPKDYSEFESEGERFKELKAESLVTLKGQLDTLQGERVKSIEELMIANYLFLHGVNYEYERNYSGDYETEGRAYQPDFYLTDYDIWLEHFGVNEHGRCPWIEAPVEEQKYIDGMKWKRNIHEANGTKLIESYSWWNKDHDLINKLQALLAANGVELTEDEKLLGDIYGVLSGDDKYLRSMASLVTTFLSLVKSNNMEMHEVADKGRDAYEDDGYMWHRFELFMTFVEPIMAIYQGTLHDKNQVDFDDMINMAADKINADGCLEAYKYIIVDEYQDISRSRFGLIDAIRKSCGAKLMCVGDDWQSIYRFAGSDVSLFTDFGKYVGYHETLKLERTYRNSQELVDIASKFIERNPEQIRKEMQSAKNEDMPLVISYLPSMVEGFEALLQNIIDEQEGQPGSILVLGRHNFDIETIYPDFKNETTYFGEHIQLKRNRENDDVRISFNGFDDITYMSVHRAKGLEADNVVVLNLINGMYGFPNRIEDDPILRLLLGVEDDFEFAEERRLFYVAVTRTKNRTYLVSGDENSGGGPSIFVDEIVKIGSKHTGLFKSDEQELRDPILCPRCGMGRLVLRQNSQTGNYFLGCTNYPYCENSYSQTEILNDRIKCPECGGWMVRRRNSHDGSSFFGCSNYPQYCYAVISTDENYQPIPKSNNARNANSEFSNQNKSYTSKIDNDHSEKSYYKSNRSSETNGSTKGGLKCPECGAKLKLRRNNNDGSMFYGCARFPDCRYTRNK